MKGLRLTLALGAFFVAVVALSACGSSMPGNSVASVAGNPISTTAFDHWMFVAAKGNSSQSPGSPVIVPNDPPQFKNCVTQVRAQIPTLAKQSDKTIQSDCKQLFTSLSSQVMDFLIRASWYQALAHKLNINVTSAQIQQAFDTAKKQQFPTATAFQAFLNSSGQTLQDILFRVRVNQIYSKLLARHETTVTNAEIQKYFTTHQSQFGTPEKRNIRIVRTNTLAAAKAAEAALKSGQSWDAVVKKYSVDAATKKTGGLLQGVTQGQEEQALNTASFAAPTNKIVGPIHGQFGYYVFEVTKISPATHETLAKATPLIKQVLSGQSQTAAQNAVDAQAKKLWLHQTTCRSDFAMADCTGFKAPKASTAVTPSTATQAPTQTPAPTTTAP